jgi:hypothetical protein
MITDSLWMRGSVATLIVKKIKRYIFPSLATPLQKSSIIRNFGEKIPNISRNYVLTITNFTVICLSVERRVAARK